MAVPGFEPRQPGSQTPTLAASAEQKTKIQEAGAQTPITLSLSEEPHTMHLPSGTASAPRSTRGGRSQNMIQAGEEEEGPRCPGLLFKGLV